MNDKKLEELLQSCGNSSKAMRAVAHELRSLGLEAYADLLEKAQNNLTKCAMVHYEDTRPINLS